MIYIVCLILSTSYLFANGCVMNVADSSELLVRSGQYCYYISEEELTRDQASASCKRSNGSLATIRNENVQRTLYNHILNLASTGTITAYQFWIGARLGPDDQPLWDSEEIVAYSNLADDQQYRVGSNCLLLAIDNADETGEWVTGDCSRAVWFYGHICEFNLPNAAEKTFNAGNILLLFIVSTFVSVFI